MLISFGSSEFPVGSVQHICHLSDEEIWSGQRQWLALSQSEAANRGQWPMRGQRLGVRVIPNWSAAKPGSCGGKLSSRATWWHWVSLSTNERPSMIQTDQSEAFNDPDWPMRGRVMLMWHSWWQSHQVTLSPMSPPISSHWAQPLLTGNSENLSTINVLQICLIVSSSYTTFHTGLWKPMLSLSFRTSHKVIPNSCETIHSGLKIWWW